MERAVNNPVCQNATLKSNKGFSLLEMLIVMAIMGIILTVSTISYLTLQQKGRDAKRRTDIESLRTALEIYRSQNSAYPAIAGNNAWAPASNLNASLVVPGYMQSIPTDPNQNATYPYMYKSWSSWQRYCIEARFEQGSSVYQCVASVPPPTPGYYDYTIVNP